MALLNYKGTFSADTLSTYTGSNVTQANQLKIVVMPDSDGVSGHLMTHGIDFGRTFDGHRGLVPALPSGAIASQSFLRGNGWSTLWTQTAETNEGANKDSYLQSTLVSAYDIKQWIAQSFTANDALRFKGVIKVMGTNSDSYELIPVGGDPSNPSVAFPTTCEVGDVYKVNDTTNRMLAGQVVNSGDLLICIKAGTKGTNDAANVLNNSQYWTVVQSNVEYTSNININGSGKLFYTADLYSGLVFFAPVTSGAQGQLLVSNGTNNAPIWVNPANITVGTADKVGHTLTASTSFTLTDGFDGSADKTLYLNRASTTILGGVTIDSGEHSMLYNSNTPNTKYPTISIETTGVNAGQIYLTRDNVVNALGFTPGNANGSVTKIVATNSASSNSNTQTANPYVNIIGDANNVLASFQLAGSGNIGVTSAGTSNAITISLGAANSTDYGGVKLGYSENGKNYALQLDNGKAYVNVPWVSTLFNATTDGLAPAASNANKQTNSADNVAGATTFLLGADAKWYKLPSSSFQGDRRVVKLNTNTEVIAAASGNALNIVAGTHVTIAAEQTTGANPTYTGKLTFNAAWRDVQVHRLTTSNGITTISNNAESIGDNSPLTFENSESVYMIGADNGNATEVSAYLTWYNIDDGSYELV